MKLKDYKEFEINVSNDGMFSADGIDESYPSLDDLTNAIDASLKVKYEPVDGFCVDIHGGVSEFLITSPHSNRWDKNSFWTKCKKTGKRSTRSNVILDTPENRALLIEYVIANKKRNEFYEQMNALKEKMQSLKIVLKTK